ncbi:MAG: sulfatase-like hydrolase/transferase [Clostridiales bacterium]|nr:sulfatase-like hydrolase/transferase [Clostridiales bacterium]
MKTYLDELTDEEKVRSRKANPMETPIEESFTFGYRVTQRALKFIKAHKDQDFFLVVSYDEPHDPGLCPEPYASMYKDVELEKTPAYSDDLQNKPALQRYWGARNMTEQAEQRPVKPARLLGCNSFVDDLLGRVMDAARTLTPDALRLFTSDHVDAIGAHRLFAKGPSIYDEIARVPLIMEGPGVPAGAVYEHAVSHIDLPATVLDWFHLPRPAMLEGRSLLPQVGDPALPTGRPAFVEFGRYEIDHDGFGGFQPMRAAVTDTWRLALHVLDTDELYNTADDPYCLNNRINDPSCQSERNALHDQIIDWMNATRDPFRGYQWQARPWRASKQPSWDMEGYTRQRENDPGEYRQRDYGTGLPMEKATRLKG